MSHIKECIGAIIAAAATNGGDYGWNRVMDLPLRDVVEQLEESGVKTPEAAVQMFGDWASLVSDAELERLNKAFHSVEF